MNNPEVVAFFEHLADLMEIRGDDGFRVNAYRRVARAVDDLSEDINAVAARNELTNLPGVGKGSSDHIKELLSTGTTALWTEVAATVPPTLLELREISGLGPKKIAAIWQSCGVTNLEELKAALAANKLDGLKGFGAKSIEGIKRGIEIRAQASSRHRLGVATDIAEHIRTIIRNLPGVERVEHCGSLRRGRETIGDLDLLCITANGPEVIQQFTTIEGVAQVLVAGDTKASVLYQYRPDRSVQVDLRVVPAESFGACWQYFSGSKEHNVRLRELAQKRGWSLNEYGLIETATKRTIASRTEEEIYAALGLPWIPPELREDRDEFSLKETPRLIELADIRGDLHMHTRASDGRSTIEEMIAGAKSRGYEYICITDHSQASIQANGLNPDRLRKHIAEIRAVAALVKGITVWVGAEVDILSAGRLDYEDALLAELDWVVASVHQGMSQEITLNTQRTLAAIRSPYVNLIAHPTGRLINRRDPMPLDMDAVIKEAARTGTALEINASEYRLDLRDIHARAARDAGVTICIDTDAHAIDQLDQMRFGVITARRAALRKEDVLNTRTAAGIRSFVANKRKPS